MQLSDLLKQFISLNVLWSKLHILDVCNATLMFINVIITEVGLDSVRTQQCMSHK